MARVQATERPARPAEDQEAAKRCLVAIIEDDAEFRTMLRELLEEEQYRVVGLANGAEALEALRGDALPNVILLDVSMPVMDGFDFLRFRNEDSQLAAVPVVLVSNAQPPPWPGLGLRLQEAGEHVRQLFRRNADAGIAHGEQHLVVERLGAHLHGAAVGGGLDRVADEVAERLQHALG